MKYRTITIISKLSNGRPTGGICPNLAMMCPTDAVARRLEISPFKAVQSKYNATSGLVPCPDGDLSPMDIAFIKVICILSRAHYALKAKRIDYIIAIY